MAAPLPKPAKPTRRLNDAELLAEFIAKHWHGKIDPEIAVVVKMYVPSYGAKRAA